MPDVIPGGSPDNPMGAAALTLGGDEFAIHGTNKPGSIGGGLWSKVEPGFDIDDRPWTVNGMAASETL